MEAENKQMMEEHEILMGELSKVNTKKNITKDKSERNQNHVNDHRLMMLDEVDVKMNKLIEIVESNVKSGHSEASTTVSEMVSEQLNQMRSDLKNLEGVITEMTPKNNNANANALNHSINVLNHLNETDPKKKSKYRNQIADVFKDMYKDIKYLLVTHDID